MSLRLLQAVSFGVDLKFVVCYILSCCSHVPLLLLQAVISGGDGKVKARRRMDILVCGKHCFW